MITYDRITAACRGRSYKAVLRGEDARMVRDCVNLGIDSHLEACFVEGRDSYSIRNGGPVSGGELHCSISPESLPVLLRRLCELGTEEAEFLAYDILGTLRINVNLPLEIVSPVDAMEEE